jgi:phycoerythrin-associated linker protein
MPQTKGYKKIQEWIRSGHVICSGNFFILETFDYSMVVRFSEYAVSLGGILISVTPLDKVWIGKRRQVILYQAKVSLNTPHHDLKEYWFKYGSLYTRFNKNYVVQAEVACASTAQD